MKLSQLKQQIEELDAKAKANPTSTNCYSIEYKISGLFTDNGPELLRRLLVAKEALEHERTALSILHNRLRDGIATIGKEDLELGMKQLSAALATIRGEEE